MSCKAVKKAVPKPVYKEAVDIKVYGDGLMKDIGGSDFGVFNQGLLEEVLRTGWVIAKPDVRDLANENATRMISAALSGFGSQNEIEGMLAAQATAMHLVGMECLRRSNIPEQNADVASRLRRDGINMFRGMTDMLSALAKQRGQGQQKVTVEHVHVHSGGQAVVGTVSRGGALPAPAEDFYVTADTMLDALDHTAPVEVATGGKVGGR